MSVLSTITSSLPNVLNILQGKWDVQYIKNAKAMEDVNSKLASLRNTTKTALNFLNGQPNIEEQNEWKSLDFDSFIDIQEIQDTNITTSPIEGGSFRSVNKMRKPKQVKVTLAKAGIGYGIEDTLAEVKRLLPLARYGGQKAQQYGINEVATNVASSLLSGFQETTTSKSVQKPKNNMVMLFRVVTPFDMIDNLNLIKLDYTFKKDNGRNMLLMYLTFQEILQDDTGLSSSKKKVKNPTNTTNENIGILSATKGA